MKAKKIVFSIPEVAVYLGVSKSEVYRYLKRDENPLPAVKMGDRTRRVLLDDLEEWLESQKGDL